MPTSHARKSDQKLQALLLAVCPWAGSQVAAKSISIIEVQPPGPCVKLPLQGQDWLGSLRQMWFQNPPFWCGEVGWCQSGVAHARRRVPTQLPEQFGPETTWPPFSPSNLCGRLQRRREEYKGVKWDKMTDKAIPLKKSISPVVRSHAGPCACGATRRGGTRTDC